MDLLGRDLSKTLIVDNLMENYALQPDNGIYIKEWTNDPNDDALIELAPILTEIVEIQIDDVRKALQIF